MSEKPAATPDGYCTNKEPVSGTIRQINATATGRSSSTFTAAATPHVRAAATACR
ncbi:hypothetical protein [Streptomyces bicolor]|uniref:hypothetical protein n=1 Tax=Streptomyces bicolor TaxID=66874 RepID=UPI000AA4F9F4|nr:hypothetical protein [Streptomyces bicolor]